MLRLLLSATIFLGLCTCTSGAEPYVTGWYQPLTEGYQLYFAVHNTLDDEMITDWSITTADARDPFGPVGWMIYQDARKVEWYAPDSAYRVFPGQTLGGFGLVAESAPGTLSWWMLSNKWSYVGSVTPALIPEPSSLLALGTGALGLLGLRLRRRRMNHYPKSLYRRAPAKHLL